MGIYINIGNAGFQSARNGEYVDKSGLIAVMNGTLFTERRFGCVTRCRRFGKSMAAKMLYAYYDHSCDSRSLFADLGIAHDPSFEKHLNKYPAIYLDMTNFVSQYKSADIVDKIDAAILEDVSKAYPDVAIAQGDKLMDYLLRVSIAKKEQFVFIIDEWDAICREFAPGSEAMDAYVGWLRRMFKSQDAMRVFACAYMTGILPIKKYKTESALNNFVEYSMLEPRRMGHFFGFTKEEVRALAEKYDMDFDELVKWYDGYQIGDELSIFNPNSVMQAIDAGRCRGFGASTGAYDAVARYIQMNYEGLKDDIIQMLAGGRCKVNPTKFQNDMSIIRSKDDVLTVLIHLGYLSYSWQKSECYIPNKEVAGEMVNAIEDNHWTNVIKALEASEELLQATLDGDEEAVARGVDAAHDEHTSILSYNNENSLACVLSLAYYYAKNDYVMHRELATGKGFADIVLIPRKNVDSPAILLGGVYEQIVSSCDGQPPKTIYIHLGSNVWFKMFNNGIHADKKLFTPHNPISVTGGDYDKFYLSGMFRPDATADADNAECYISGGRFGEVAGAGMEKINGNVYWQIDHADIEAFYGGGINDAQPVQGHITTDITNCHVITFCGGPKFGDMMSDMNVNTTATGCTFGQYFGAGYGGTSFNRIRKYNYNSSSNYDFNNTWVTSYSRQYETDTGASLTGSSGPSQTANDVNAIATNYEYELFAYAGFGDNNNVGRFYVNYASLSLAITKNVTSTLTGCKITGNFYGGGSLGKVEGDVTSTLTDCTVLGNVFGAGYSAAAPTVEVMAKTGFTTEPWYDGNSGFYIQGVYPASVTYTWSSKGSNSSPFTDDDAGHWILTTVDMTTLGTVTGTARLTIGGNSVIGTAGNAATSNVYGGGDESAVNNTTTPTKANTIVTLKGNARVLGNVFGGGNEGVVSGTATVNIKE